MDFDKDYFSWLRFSSHRKGKKLFMKLNKLFSFLLMGVLTIGIVSPATAFAADTPNTDPPPAATESAAPTSQTEAPVTKDIPDSSIKDGAGIDSSGSNGDDVTGTYTGKKLDVSGLDTKVYKLPEGNKVKADCKTECRSITVSPATIEMSPDDVYHSKWKKFRVINNGMKPMHVLVFATQFSQQANGNIVLSDPENKEASANWIQLYPNELNLQPDEYQNVYIAVDAPDDAPAGDQNVSIVFRDPGSEKQGAINIAGQIGTKVFIQVPGDVEHRIILNGADSTKPKENYVHEFAGISQSGPEYDFNLTVENKGTVHEDFVQDNKITGVLSGWQVFSPMKDTYLQAPEAIVARDSTRNLTVNWTDDYTKQWDSNYAAKNNLQIVNPPVFCFCSATFKAYDGNGNVAIYDVSFIIFPIWQTIVALVILGLIIFWLIYRRRKNKRLKAELEELRRRQGSTVPAPSGKNSINIDEVDENVSETSIIVEDGDDPPPFGDTGGGKHHRE